MDQNAAASPEVEIVLRAKGLVVERQLTDEGARYRFSGRCASPDPAFLDELGRLGERILSESVQPILDLGPFELANSGFVSLVLRIVAQLLNQGRRLVIVGPDRRTLDLFGIVGILDALDIREPSST